MFDWDSLEDIRVKDIFIGKLNVSEGYRRKHQPIIDRINCFSAMNDMYADERARAKIDNDFMEALYSTLNDSEIQFIKDEIEQSEGGYEFNFIRDKPNLAPECEKDDDNCFTTYAEQWSEYPCEDCYSGYVYVELIENEKYLKWSFSM